MSSLFNSAIGFWLLLACLPKFGAKRQQAVLDGLGSLDKLATSNAATLRALGLQADTIGALEAWQRGNVSHPLVARVLAIHRDCQQHQIQLMTMADEDYPPSLRHIHHPPLVLYLKGDRALAGKPQLAIVGSRNASRAGLEHARVFASALGQRGLLVTSGLALGVDGAAHAGALDAGCATVAVIGNGIDQPYPQRHSALAQRIVSAGLLMSEYPPGTDARPAHFPQRNRIISGLSRGILVVEAGLKSGSLITARLALEQGREVFAIPGSIHNPLARGCHDLIRQGAVLAENVQDILDELGSEWVSGYQTPEKPTPCRTDQEQKVLAALGFELRSTDDLCSASGLSADELMQILVVLELDGVVSAEPGGYLRLK